MHLPQERKQHSFRGTLKALQRTANQMSKPSASSRAAFIQLSHILPCILKTKCLHSSVRAVY